MINATSYTQVNTSNFMGYCYQDGIFNYMGEQIGVTLDKYKEVEQALLKCKNRLIELGEIKIPKTQEEIIKEQSEMIERQQALLNELVSKMGVNNGLETDFTGNDTRGQETTSNRDGYKTIERGKSSSNNKSK